MNQKDHIIDQKGLKRYEKKQKIEFLDLKYLLFSGIFLSGIGGYPTPPLAEIHPAQNPLAERGLPPPPLNGKNPLCRFWKHSLFWWSCLLLIFWFHVCTCSLALEYFLKASIAETEVGLEYGWVWRETFCFWTLYDQKEFTWYVFSKRSWFQFFNLIGHKQWLVCLMCLKGTWEDQDSKWEILSELCSEKIIIIQYSRSISSAAVVSAVQMPRKTKVPD